MDVKLLKTNIWSGNLKQKIRPDVFYDEPNDTLTMIFPHTEGRILTHYVDYYVGLLFRHADKEIVGIQIDSFAKRFFPIHSQEKKGWCLSDSGVQIQGDDFTIYCKTDNSSVVEQVTTITSDIVKKDGIPLEPIYA